MTLQGWELAALGKSAPRSNSGTSVSGICPGAERIGMGGTVGTGLQPAPTVAVELHYPILGPAQCRGVLVGHPGQGSDLAELAPDLAPGVTGILADEHLPIVTAGQDPVGIG